ncbi:MAG: DUF1788 domain-containing protein [Desulfobacterales bacterium]|nr:DUF1788 domain-containing protein [Desulfobacterales bacterium]
MTATRSEIDNTPISSAIHALEKDLLADGGPRISTMRNYRFAILPYNPKKEFELRASVRRLGDRLRREGWNVLSISLKRILLDRLTTEDPRVIDSILKREIRLHKKDPGRAMIYLKDKIANYIEGPAGVAGAVIELIDAFADQRPDEAERTLIFIGRAGALYPFFRTSALLKYIDGKTRNIPVVLLYPGERRDLSALSFMGELPADRDYRPRIYT